MPRGKTNSDLGLQERRAAARAMIVQGFTDAEIARNLGIHRATATNYRRAYEEELRDSARSNPALLRDVLLNTIRELEELEEVRRSAWSDYHATESRQVRGMLLNTIRGVQQDRARLFGLMGIKPEFLIHVQTVKLVQDKVLNWLGSNLCDRDKSKFEQFYLREIAPIITDVQDLPAVEVPELENV